MIDKESVCRLQKSGGVVTYSLYTLLHTALAQGVVSVLMCVLQDRNDHLEQELQSLRRQLVETEEHAQDREEELRADAESQVLRVREDEAR